MAAVQCPSSTWHRGGSGFARASRKALPGAVCTADYADGLWRTMQAAFVGSGFQCTQRQRTDEQVDLAAHAGREQQRGTLPTTARGQRSLASRCGICSDSPPRPPGQPGPSRFGGSAALEKLEQPRGLRVEDSFSAARFAAVDTLHVDLHAAQVRPNSAHQLTSPKPAAHRYPVMAGSRWPRTAAS